ncbi:MAG TPA: murein transglycosylase [Rhodospirillaceae bacterium]|nr:murein transglycosylase [Rhodospirillaceae bacterium]HAT35498.1 murein transglycosylase [Rhodospirillaceae bacterium]
MFKSLKRFGGWAIATLLALIIIAAPLRLTAAPMNYSKLLKNGNLCARAIAAQERRSGIPDKLLFAVAIKETGRWIKQDRANIAWPWTVNAGGAGKHFDTKSDALRHVRALKKKGQKNIDVGCMQINLHYHPDAFATLEAGFDPATNVAYAAKFLTALKNSHGSWQQAVRHYHSANQKKSAPYQRKVFKIWKAALGNKKPTTAVAQADKQKTRPVSKSARRAAQKVERSHRKFLAELRRKFPHRFGTPARSGTPNKNQLASRFISSWPPRNYAAQRRAENLARALSFSKQRRQWPRKLTP